MLYYDLHIHSALSPCGDNDMTPNNIVNMAMLKGLDVIAVTDHNSVGNLRAIQKLAAAQDILLLPGMELETAEEIHLLCYFPDVGHAEAFEKELVSYRPAVKNRIDIFGNQYLMDERDGVIEDVENLLSMALSLPVPKAVDLVRNFGGLPVPAHVDKASYSMISNLGYIPPEYGFSTVELSKKPEARPFAQAHGLDKAYHLLQSSDAHYLWDIMERTNVLHICEKCTNAILNYLKYFTPV